MPSGNTIKTGNSPKASPASTCFCLFGSALMMFISIIIHRLWSGCVEGFVWWEPILHFLNYTSLLFSWTHLLKTVIDMPILWLLAFFPLKNLMKPAPSIKKAKLNQENRPLWDGEYKAEGEDSVLLYMNQQSPKTHWGVYVEHTLRSKDFENKRYQPLFVFHTNPGWYIWGTDPKQLNKGLKNEPTNFGTTRGTELLV